MTDTDKELVKRLREFRMGLLRADGDRDLGFRPNITTNASMALADELNTAADAIERLLADVERLMGALTAMLSVKGDHMTACDKIMGDTHPCTCGADKARSALQTGGQSE